jgi:hypothetical protein
MSLALCTLVGLIILFVAEIRAGCFRPHTDVSITNGRFEILKAHEQEVIMNGKVVSTP